MAELTGRFGKEIFLRVNSYFMFLTEVMSRLVLAQAFVSTGRQTTTTIT